MPARILVVEDNPVTRRMVCACLAREGYVVSEAETAAEALTEMARGQTDLVLQDIVLPDMDGIDLRARLAELAADAATPILAMTGVDDEARLLSSGFCDVLAKPLAPARLLSSVRAYLRHGDGTHPVPAGRRVLLVDDEPVQRRLLAALLANQGFQVSAVASGEEALAVTTRPDIVVSDVLMAGMDGLELCRRLRRDRRYAGVPIVLVSSQELTPEDHEWARRAGAATLVHRSTDEAAILAAVVAALDAPPRTAEVALRDSGLHAAAVRLEHRADVRAATDRLERIMMGAQRVLGRLQHISLGARELDMVVKEQLAALLDVLGFTMGAAYLINDAGVMVLSASLGLSGGRARTIASGWNRVALLDGWVDASDPVLVTRSAESAEGRALLEAVNINSAIVLPLRVGEERIGVMVLGSLNELLPDGALGLAKMLQGANSQAILLARTLVRLAAAEQRFHNIAEATADALLVTDAFGRVRYQNRAARELLGLADGGPERGLADLLPFVAAGSRQGTVATASGEVIPVEVAARAFDDAEGKASVVYAVRDLSQRVQLEEFAYLANHDLLTGLLNRRRFEEELASRLAEARRFDTHGALLVIDIDHFKQINDGHGHAAGDDTLRDVGATIRSMTRDCDAAARLGGDELIVLLNHADAGAAQAYAGRLRDALLARSAGPGGPVRLSIGVALFPQHGLSPETLVAAADGAMYRAKRAGRDACVIAGDPPPP